MQSENSDTTVVAFMIFPTRANNFNVESLRGQAIAKQLRETVNAVQKDVGHRLFEICLRYNDCHTLDDTIFVSF